MLLVEVLESFKVYGVSGYWYLLEIEQGLGDIVGGLVLVIFVLYLVFMVCGIYVSFYVIVNGDILVLDQVQVVFEVCYVDEFFVDVMFQGSYLEICFVKGFNYCCLVIYWLGDGDVLVVLLVIDNLVKGVFGQVI